ncbi:MAG: hypothetical protein Q8P18_32780 [Pseudomonadota bacterium]|nr:hypothetical protein [Pseudomonadota bacterium]
MRLSSTSAVRKLAATMRSFHLTFAAVGRHALFPTERARRAAVRALGRVAGAWIVLFAIVDDHVHVVVLCEEERVGRLARAIVLALRPVASAALEPAFVRPVRDRGHLESLVGYVLTQQAHHGLAEHGALATGSCYRDLLGARLVPGLTLRIGQALPRFRLREACRHVALPEVELCPVTLDVVRAAGAARVVAAASAALAVAPELIGNAAEVVEVRRAAVQLALTSGIHLAEMAHALGIGVGTARRLAVREVAEPVLRAIRLELALEAAVGAAAGLAAPCEPRA